MEPARNLQSACRHCGTLFSSVQGEDFCCSGCATVFELLQSEGLGEFYSLRSLTPPECPLPAQVSSESYAYCDDPRLLRRFSTDGRHLKFYVEGLNCTACLWLLERLPSICADASSVRVNMSDSTVEVERTESGRFSMIARTLNRLGHRPHPLKLGERSDELQLEERRRELVRIGIAGAATGNLMIMAVSLYAGADHAFAEKFRWISVVLATPVLTYCAWPFYVSAASALRDFRLNIDVPIVTAILAGIAMSTWGLMTGGETLYFDSLSMLTLLLLSSRFLLAGIQRRYLGATNLEDELLFASVLRLGEDGNRERISSLSISVGDQIVVSDEMTVPADGVVVSGNGTLNRAVLTGESESFDVKIGSSVEAGSRNLSGEWVLRADSTPSDSRIARVLADAEESSRAKSRIELVADRTAQWFVGVVLAAAFVVAAWFFSTDPTEGVKRALALTIVTCPCVFGMAIPLSMSLAIRSAARRGAVVKSANAIERLWNSRTIFFDKTGTLTQGEMRVLAVEGEPAMIEIAAALEDGQKHPVGRAIRDLVGNRKPRVTAQGVATIAEGGVEGTVAGDRYSLHPLDVVDTDSSRDELRSIYGLFGGGGRVASFELGDRARSEAEEVLSTLRTRGFSLRLLSGDRKGIVESCGKRLGFSPDEVTHGATPETKTGVLKNSGSGSVMIGDGANDAGALAAANVGIAVRGSMEVSLRAADVYLLRPDLRTIPTLFVIARKTKLAITRNLVLSVGFNLVAGTLAIEGSMTPLLAAVLMPISSVVVLLSSLATGRTLAKTKEA